MDKQIEAADKKWNEEIWRSEVVEAARKFVNCKGRYHSEQNTTALIELFRQEPEKP